MFSSFVYFTSEFKMSSSALVNLPVPEIYQNDKVAGMVVYRTKKGVVEYLLLQPCFKQRVWDPPYGTSISEENLVDAAFREARESAGLRKDQLKIKDEFSYNTNVKLHGKDVEVTFWLSEFIDKSADITLSELHQTFTWVTLAAAVDLVQQANLKSLFYSCQAFLTRGRTL